MVLFKHCFVLKKDQMPFSLKLLPFSDFFHDFDIWSNQEIIGTYIIQKSENFSGYTLRQHSWEEFKYEENATVPVKKCYSACQKNATVPVNVINQRKPLVVSIC